MAFTWQMTFGYLASRGTGAPPQLAPVNTPAQSCERSTAAKKTASRNQPTAMDLYFLDWVRTRDKTEPETHTKSAHTVLYDQAPAMNWDHAVSWGRGVWVSVSDIGRVGWGWPTGIEPQVYSREPYTLVISIGEPV